MTVPPTPQSSDTESHPPQAMMEALKGMVLAMPMARTLGLRFVHAEPGRVEMEIPVSEAFSFRPGQLQATAVFAVADFAAVAAAGSVLPPGWTNATVDTTLKIVAPAQGECLRARGRVVDAGRLLTVCSPSARPMCGQWMPQGRSGCAPRCSPQRATSTPAPHARPGADRCCGARQAFWRRARTAAASPSSTGTVCAMLMQASVTDTPCASG